MKTIHKHYRAITGYKDISPGITKVNYCQDETEDGKVIFKAFNELPTNFNEIQTEGDIEFRRSILPEGDDGSNILFLDNPDYARLLLRRQTMATKNIPLHEDDEFVRRWAALATQPAEIIEMGGGHEQYPSWGGVGDLTLRNTMLGHIKQMDSQTIRVFKKLRSNSKWCKDFVKWRDKLPKRLIYVEVKND